MELKNVYKIIFVFGQLGFTYGFTDFNTTDAVETSIYQQHRSLSKCPECTPRINKRPLVSFSCVECMCDLDCIQYGDCCIDVMIRLNLVTTQINSGFTCVSLQLESGLSVRNFRSAYDGFYLMAHFPGSDGERKPCDSDKLLPVSCRHSGISYINIECSFLNQDTDCVDWYIQSECTKQSISVQGTCKSYLVPPYFAELRYCDSRRSLPFVSQCALDSGHDSKTQELYMELCEKYFYLVYDADNVVYKNYFCFLCNGDEDTQFRYEIMEFGILELTSFLDQSENDIYEERCEGKEAWMDIRANKCRPIQCYSNKVLIDGNCVGENKTALGNEYHLICVLELSTHEREPTLVQAITNVMSRMSFDMFSTNYQLTASHQVINNDTGVSYVHLNIWFVINKNVTLDDFETYIVRIHPQLLFADLRMFYSISYSEQPRPSSLYKIFKSDQQTGLCCSLEHTLNIPESNKFEPITNQLSCSFVEFDQSEFAMNNMVVFVHHLNITLHQGKYSVYNGKLTVCFQTLMAITGYVYDNETRIYTASKEPSVHSNITWYLTIICITLSIISLLLTFISYVRFPEMRTQPGINNMCLCINLFLAQVMLMAGIDQVDKPILCLAFGIIIHYLWLSTLAWMNVCSFHMFKVFVLQKFFRPSSNVFQIVKYIIFSNGIPLVVVTAIIVTNWQLSNGTYLGYGGHICYLSSKRLVGYCFVLPLCIVIVSNVIFFVCTVCSIHRVKQTGKQTGERNNIFIYIKLSVVTGIFWLFSILSNVIHSEIMVYIAVILNGSQGVFLLWSFVFNRTVLLKWKAIFIQSINSSAGGETTTTELKT